MKTLRPVVEKNQSMLTAPLRTPLALSCHAAAADICTAGPLTRSQRSKGAAKHTSKNVASPAAALPSVQASRQVSQTPHPAYQANQSMLTASLRMPLALSCHAAAADISTAGLITRSQRSKGAAKNTSRNVSSPAASLPSAQSALPSRTPQPACQADQSMMPAPVCKRQRTMS